MIALLTNGRNDLKGGDHCICDIEDPKLHLIERARGDKEGLMRCHELESVWKSFWIGCRSEPCVAKESKGLPCVLFTLLLDKKEAIVEEKELAREEGTLCADL